MASGQRIWERTGWNSPFRVLATTFYILYEHLKCTKFELYKYLQYKFFDQENIAVCVIQLKRWLLKPEWNGLFPSVLFWIIQLEAILHLLLDSKNFDLGIPDPKSKLVNIKPKNYGPFCSRFSICPTNYIRLKGDIAATY